MPELFAFNISIPQFPLGRSGSLPFFPNLNLKSPDSFKQEEKDAGLLDHQLLSGRLQDVVKAFAANNATFPLPTSICNNWQSKLSRPCLTCSVSNLL